MTIYGRYTTDISRLFVTVHRCNRPDCLSDAEYKAVPPFFAIFAYPETNFLLNQTRASYRTLKTDLFFNVNPAIEKVYGAHLFLREVELDDSSANIWP